ncbi:glutaminyl-peptide cyclotransferase [Streptomyces sp. enrichment culture]|uniref:glutaminyl-peptide cyclotransferase n=1 Tax=Streptomyces sp. enrichment culture TaxID=1795815 RepID=UPI003F54CCB8
MRRRGPAVLAGVLLLALSTAATSTTAGPPDSEAAAGIRAAGVREDADPVIEQLRVDVMESFPHDPQAFTQGLEIAGGTLYESTGLFGRSSVRAGSLGAQPRVRAALPALLFGEGITVLGRTLWQLTWQNRIAIERDASTLRELRRVAYPDDGWGVCHQRARDRLVTSDGSARLTFRDRRTLARTGQVTVTENGRAVEHLNELECVGGVVYANVLFTDRIVRIDPMSGAVTASIDASGLLRDGERVPGSALNGVAAIPGTDQFLVTGKLWPRMFRVVFVPAGRAGGSGGSPRTPDGR